PLRIINQLTVALLLVSLCSVSLVLTPTRAKASPAPDGPTVIDKVSPDLRALIATGNGSQRINVVVQTVPLSPSLIGTLLDLVLNLGGTILATLSNLNIQLVDIQANAVDALAANNNVLYVSLDNTVR